MDPDQFIKDLEAAVAEPKTPAQQYDAEMVKEMKESFYNGTPEVPYDQCAICDGTSCPIVRRVRRRRRLELRICWNCWVNMKGSQ